MIPPARHLSVDFAVRLPFATVKKQIAHALAICATFSFEAAHLDYQNVGVSFVGV